MIYFFFSFVLHFILFQTNTCLRSKIEKCSIPVFNLVHISIERDCLTEQSHLHWFPLISVKLLGQRQFDGDSLVDVMTFSVVVVMVVARSGILVTLRTESPFLLDLLTGSSFCSSKLTVRYAAPFDNNVLFSIHRHSVWFSKVNISISGWVTPLVATWKKYRKKTTIESF